MEKIWACEENFLVSYLSQRENLSLDPAKIESGWLEFKAEKPAKLLRVEGDTARIKIEGPLSRSGPDFIDMLCGYGGTSYLDITNALAEAAENPDVKNVILEMDTPGGEVSGVDSVYEAVKEAAAKKNVVAENHGMIASGGMWIACAADRIEAVEPTAFTGSIGVVITAVDFSQRYEQGGVKVVHIVSRNAPEKRVDIKTEEGRSVLQREADAIERHFLDRVAQGRGVSVDYVIENFGRGGIMIAQDLDPDTPDAISVGLIDGLVKGPHDQFVVGAEEDMAAMGDKSKKTVVGFIPTSIISETPAVAGKTPDEGDNEEVQRMDLKQAMAEHPAIKAEVDQKVAEARKAGVEAGRAEIQARIDKATPYIGNDAYAGIESLAVKVLKGDEETSALVGAVTAFDMLKEKGKSAAAASETEELEETPGQEQSAQGSGLVSSEADIDALLEGAK